MVLLGVWEIFISENNCNCYFYKSRHKFVFILLTSSSRAEKHESLFQQAGGLVTQKHPFCLQRVALYFKRIPNSVDFYQEFFYMLFMFV